MLSFTEPEVVPASFVEDIPPQPPAPPPQQQHVDGNVPPPPPPPPPMPPRPGFWRFPGAEFADKGRARR